MKYNKNQHLIFWSIISYTNQYPKIQKASLRSIQANLHICSGINNYGSNLSMGYHWFYPLSTFPFHHTVKQPESPGNQTTLMLITNAYMDLPSKQCLVKFKSKSFSQNIFCTITFSHVGLNRQPSLFILYRQLSWFTVIRRSFWFTLNRRPSWFIFKRRPSWITFNRQPFWFTVIRRSF